MPGTRDRRLRHRAAPRRSRRFSLVVPLVVPALCLAGLWWYTAVGFEQSGDRTAELIPAALLGTAATLTVLIGMVVRANRERRSALGRLADLQQKTEHLALRLPGDLAAIERGERPDLSALVPHSAQGTDEFEQVATTIHKLVYDAVSSTMRQSQSRERADKVLAQLIRRAQTLIHRLIPLLDDLERKHGDSDLLKDIFRVDHLATRIQRHVENLMIVSGAAPRRRTAQPESITDVMRRAVAETERYTRVSVKSPPADWRVAVADRAVADVTHLLAELVENGTNFSPPETQVTVSAAQVARGLAVHVEDQGLGMEPDQLARANQLLANPPRIDMTALGQDPRLGHVVVAQLAQRHGIKVEVRGSVYGGTLAIVVLPSELLEHIPSPVVDHLQAAVAAAGRTVESRTEAPPLTTADDHSYTRQAVSPAAGVAMSAPEGAAARPTVPDHSGFPQYAGEGLLPRVPGHPAPTDADSTPWTPTASTAVQSGPRAERERYAPSPNIPAPESEPPPGHRQPAQPTPPEGAAASRTTPDHRTPDGLPRRVKGANLAESLRRQARTGGGSQGPGEPESVSPERAAQVMGAIHLGLAQARMRNEPHGARQDESAIPPADEL